MRKEESYECMCHRSGQSPTTAGFEASYALHMYWNSTAATVCVPVVSATMNTRQVSVTTRQRGFVDVSPVKRNRAPLEAETLCSAQLLQGGPDGPCPSCASFG
jgi:hypothetical protein